MYELFLTCFIYITSLYWVAFIVKKYFKPTFIYLFIVVKQITKMVFEKGLIYWFTYQSFFFLYDRFFSVCLMYFATFFLCNNIDHPYILFIHTYLRGYPPIMIKFSNLYDKPTTRCHRNYPESYGESDKQQRKNFTSIFYHC